MSATPRNLLYATIALALVAGLAGCVAEEEATPDGVDTDPGPGSDIGPETDAGGDAVDTDPGPGSDIGPESGIEDDAGLDVGMNESVDTDPGPGEDLGPEDPATV